MRVTTSIGYTNENTSKAYTIDTPNAFHKSGPTNPSQARWINALPSSDKKSLSPRVVSNRRMPILGPPPGLNASQIDMASNRHTMVMKNIAVGLVQAIHARLGALSDWNHKYTATPITTSTDTNQPTIRSALEDCTGSFTEDCVELMIIPVRARNPSRCNYEQNRSPVHRE